MCYEAPWEVEGITVLGGEPFEQAAAVAAVLRLTRERGLSSMVYSGHTYEHLASLASPGVMGLLSQTDILVDGPYLPRLYSDTIAWRGSTNQRLLCLTNRYTPESLAQAFAQQGKGFSIQVGRGRVSLSGMQDRDSAAVAEELLQRVDSG